MSGWRLSGLIHITFALHWLPDGTNACTTVIVGREATVDGSVIATHSADNSDLDFRMAYVPARKHPAGARRPVYQASRAYPRLVSHNRAEIYRPRDASQQLTEPLGSIPEVSETYAFYESGYGLINEHGLGMGETTGNARGASYSVATGGSALFGICELQFVALERCRSAVCAIHTMGDLAERYGFYGEEQFTAEALTIVDNDGEAWVFHVAPVSNGTSAVWAAQRLPPDQVTVVANSLIIGYVDPSSIDFILSNNLFESAKKEGLWDGKGQLHFSLTFASDPPWASVRVVTPLYATMRRWRVFDLIAPSRGFRLSQSTFSYPFSVTPDKKLSINDVFAIYRDHFEGTPYDMTKGIFAGPFGNPNRQETSHSPFFNGVVGKKQGQFQRPISIPRGSYVSAVQTHIAHPKVWWAGDTGASSVFVPFFAGALRHGVTKLRCDENYASGNQLEFRFGKSAWWAFDFVANWMNLNYQNMSQRYVFPMMKEMQQYVEDQASKAELAPHQDGRSLEEAQIAIQRHVVDKWWELASTLIVRYNDGFLNFEPGKSRVQNIPYSKEYLQHTGFNCELGISAEWPKVDARPQGLLSAIEGSTPSVYAEHPPDVPWGQCPPKFVIENSQRPSNFRSEQLEAVAGARSDIVQGFSFSALCFAMLSGVGFGAMATLAVARRAPAGQNKVLVPPDLNYNRLE